MLSLGEVTTLGLPLSYLQNRQYRVRFDHIRHRKCNSPIPSCTPGMLCKISQSQANQQITVHPHRMSSRKVLLAHGPITSIPVQTLDAHRGGLLAGVEPLALTLAEGGQVVSVASLERDVRWDLYTL